ncbi:MAG: type 1 glutamine amidotransferase, partial [Micropruina sp.]
MSWPPNVLMIQHQAECPPARFGSWLGEAGVALTLWTPDLPMPELSCVDGLVILGGVMGATDDQDAPWLPLVRQTIRQAAGHGLPTLGICLGHQLAAVALGGRVQRNPHGKQRGVTPIGWTDGAHLDPLFSPAAPSRG